jgi:hypothetical protein
MQGCGAPIVRNGGFRFSSRARPLCFAALHSHEERLSMKLVATLLGIALIVVAVMYFMLPADSLPGFFPGHEAGVIRIHVKHGVVAAVAGVVLLALGWFMGRR